MPSDLDSAASSTFASWAGGSSGSSGTVNQHIAVYRDIYASAIAGPYPSPTSGHGLRVANGWAGYGPRRGVSVGSLQLAVSLPMVFIGLRPYYSAAHNLPLTPTGDRAFDARFEVRAHDPDFAAELIGPQVRAIMMSRDDWSFMLAGNQVIAVCAAPYQAGDEMTERIAMLGHISAAMPASAVARAGRAMRTLADGTVLDDSDPGRLEAALAAMPAQERDLLQARIAADRARRHANRGR